MSDKKMLMARDNMIVLVAHGIEKQALEVWARFSRGRGTAMLYLTTLAMLVTVLAAACDRPRLTPAASPSPSHVPIAPSGDGFSIYLTDPEIPPDKLAIQSHLELAAQPILRADDIISYAWEMHEITLTAEAVGRLQALKVPTSGKSFVVCVGRAPIYAGAFWAAYSSQSFDGVVIDPILVTLERPTIQIQLGYPGLTFFHGEDPRPDPRIRAALEAAGKLR